MSQYVYLKRSFAEIILRFPEIGSILAVVEIADNFELFLKERAHRLHVSKRLYKKNGALFMGRYKLR